MSFDKRRLIPYAVAFALAATVVLLWRYVVALIALVAALLVLGWTGRIVAEALAVARFRAAYAGKDVLLVYSNSPHWQRYVEEMWLPKWGERAVLLNWSERQNWTKSPEVRLFRVFLGGEGFAREYNPAAIVVPRTGRRVTIVRFWRAFRDFKHGDHRLLRQAEADLQQALNAVTGPTDDRNC